MTAAAVSAVEDAKQAVEAAQADDAPLSTPGEQLKPTPKPTAEQIAKHESDALAEAVKMANPGRPFVKTLEESGETPRGKDGKFLPKKVEAKDEPKEDKPVDAVEGVKPEPKPDAETPDSRERDVMARRALRRDGWDDKEIDGLSPAQRLSIGEKRAGLQAKTDERINELRAKAEKPGTAFTPATKADDKKAATKAAGEDGTDEGTDPDLVPASVLEYLDDATKTDLLRHVKSRTASAIQPVREALGQMAASLAEERGISIQRELSAEFPALKAEKPPATYLARISKLAPAYDVTTRAGVAELMRDAAVIEYGPALHQQARDKAIEANRAARNGVPDTRDLSGRGAGRIQNKEEIERLALEAAVKGGGNLHRAQAELQRLTKG